MCRLPGNEAWEHQKRVHYTELYTPPDGEDRRQNECSVDDGVLFGPLLREVQSHCTRGRINKQTNIFLEMY